MAEFDSPYENDADVDGTDSSADDGKTRLCIVLCKGEAPGDLSRAGEIVSYVFGRGYSADVNENNIVMISKGEDAVGFLAHMPAPIPDQAAEHCADGNFLWPEGNSEVAGYRSHVIVANAGGEEETPIQSALTVTRLALVALELFDGMGVFWGDANVCNSREVFEEFCTDMSEEHVPTPVWLRFQFGRVSDDEVSLYTLGMQQFGLMDIEVDRSTVNPGELFEFVSNVAHYLIQQGPVIADGNTVGESEEQRIRVRHLPSMVDEERTVYKIVYED